MVGNVAVRASGALLGLWPQAVAVADYVSLIRMFSVERKEDMNGMKLWNSTST